MNHNEQYWKDKYDFIQWRYELLLKNWQQLLVKEVTQERELMEKDKVIIALQDRVKKYEAQR